jgi:hypothetical protein
MRNAKFMLTVIVTIGILSAALGFKAKTFSSHFLYTGVLHSGVCTTKILGAKFCSDPPNVAAATTPMFAGCPDICTVETSD